ncbi:MAG: ATP-dependent helicase, partial [Candidatus Electrothrix sp. ATG1]|nr:ATP-dependent helicase [Candidatus Electrothrix sp. ATG1]
MIKKLPEERDLERLSRNGWLSFVSGNYEEARVSFDQNLQLAKKISRQKKIFFQNEIGLIHLLTLLAGNDRKLLSQGLEYIKIVQKKGYYYASVTEAMKPVFQQQLGLDETESYRDSLNTFDDNPLQFLVFNLILFWTDKARAKENISALEAVKKKAEKNGYLWIAAELSSILAALNVKKNSNTVLSKKLHSTCGTQSCINLVKKIPQWEKKLDGLLTITGEADKSGQGVEAEQRLVWLFSHNERYGYCSITPKMQKLTKGGTWTKGRPVALKNLYDNYATMEGLSNQDRRVCQAVKAEYYSGSWRSYGKTEYELDKDQALPALAGHPHLFLENAPDVQVELVVAEPELAIREEKGKLRLTLSPPPPSREDKEIQVVKDTPTRFKLYRFTDKHREIGQFLGKGITIPKSGAQKAQQVVESLSSVVTVLSDLDGTTEAETRK